LLASDTKETFTNYTVQAAATAMAPDLSLHAVRSLVKVKIKLTLEQTMKAQRGIEV
jgi:hypothetical protein